MIIRKHLVKIFKNLINKEFKIKLIMNKKLPIIFYNYPRNKKYKNNNKMYKLIMRIFINKN